MTAIGILPAYGPTSTTTGEAETREDAGPARARPELGATPVLDRDPPVGSARKKPPAVLAVPWATKSADPAVGSRRGWGPRRRCPPPAPVRRARPRPRRGPAPGTTARSGSENVGRCAGSRRCPDPRDFVPSHRFTAVTTSSATSVASVLSGLSSRDSSHATTVAAATSHGGNVPAARRARTFDDLAERCWELVGV